MRLGYEDGRRIRPGHVLTHKGIIRLCEFGLHASKNILDALSYSHGSSICRVECSGSIIHGDDKLVCTRRKVLYVVEGKDIIGRFSRLCALDVVDLWDAPKVVVEFLKTGDESIRAAAGVAARAAAGDAARDAAWDAAWDAEKKKQATWFKEYFGSPMPVKHYIKDYKLKAEHE